MPLTSFDIHTGAYSADERQAISDAVHSAMMEVLGIPSDDRLHVFSEHPAATMIHDSVIFGLPRTQRLMFVTFSFNNREPELKQRLFARTVERLREIAGVGSDEVMFRVLETPNVNWWADGRAVDPKTGYDERMNVSAGE